MERRKAITTAAAASLTLLAGAAGIALNSGIVGSGGHGVGTLNPVNAAATTPVTVYVDGPPSDTIPATPSIQATTRAPITTSSSSGYRTHDNEDGGREYEGAEDDD